MTTKQSARRFDVQNVNGKYLGRNMNITAVYEKILSEAHKELDKMFTKKELLRDIDSIRKDELECYPNATEAETDVCIGDLGVYFTVVEDLTK